MDIRNGDIYTAEELLDLKKQAEASAKARETIDHLREMNLPLTRRQRATGRVGRNDRCPCGSGKKFKRCCLEVTK